MANQPPQQQPQQEQRPHTFVGAAAWGKRAALNDPTLTAVDPVIQRCPTLRFMESLVVLPPQRRAAVPCAESVLRLALTLVHKDKDKPSATIVALHTEVPPEGLTLDNLLRRLRRMVAYGVGDFPVYAARAEAERIKFYLVHGTPRSDNYAIVLLPAGVDGNNPPMPPLPHWAFMLVEPSKEPEQDEPVSRPVMIYTRMPVQTSERVYWRCQPTPETARLFHESESRGQACSCCQQVVCWHELRWRCSWFMRGHSPAPELRAWGTFALRAWDVIRPVTTATMRRATQAAGWMYQVLRERGQVLANAVIREGRLNGEWLLQHWRDRPRDWDELDVRLFELEEAGVLSTARGYAIGTALVLGIVKTMRRVYRWRMRYVGYVPSPHEMPPMCRYPPRPPLFRYAMTGLNACGQTVVNTTLTWFAMGESKEKWCSSPIYRTPLKPSPGFGFRSAGEAVKTWVRGWFPRFFAYAAGMSLAAGCTYILWRLFRQKSPQDRPIFVTMKRNHIMTGAYRATVTGFRAPPGWTAVASANNGVSVTLPGGFKCEMDSVRNADTIVNLGYMLGFLPSNILPFFDTWYWRIKLGMEHTLEMMTCSHKMIELPSDVQTLIVQPYEIRGSLYDRRPMAVSIYRALSVIPTLFKTMIWASVTARIMAVRSGDSYNNVFSIPWFGMTGGYGRSYQPIGYIGVVPIAAHLLMIYPLLSVASAILKRHYWQRVMTMFPKRAFADTTMLSFKVPRMNELKTRLALIDVVTRADVVDRVRRICNEERWPETLDRDELDAFLEVTVTATPGQMSIPMRPTSVCVTCGQHRRLYRQECKACKRERRARRPPERLLDDIIVAYVGRLGLWSRRAKVVDFSFKDDARIEIKQPDGRGDYIKLTICTRAAFVKWYGRQEAVETCRGWNEGPIFMGHVPECFPRGTATATLAFAIRLAAARKNAPKRWAWELALQVMLRYVEPLEPESREQFLSHFRGEKLAKMLEAERMENEGDGVKPGKHLGTYVVSFSGFTKAEKSMSHEFQAASEGWLKDKYGKRKPRFICCPDPAALLRLGPYTHAQTKWLARCFHNRKRMFYAGCATPEQLDDYINLVKAELPDGVVLCDDITAIDANHNSFSFDYHEKIRRKQFSKLPLVIEKLYQSLREIVVRIGKLPEQVRGYVDDVNASGVPDTSYKNSAICLVVRLLAITYAVFPIEKMSLEAAWECVMMVHDVIWTSAAGDDGYTTLPEYIYGVSTQSPTFAARYSEFWAACGFEVKVAVVPPHRWRLATYLAARPVWNGSRYSWMPEPARRLKTAFWQIDNSLPPRVWAKGIARQLQVVGSCQPVIRPIADMVDATISGPALDLSHAIFGNPYSPWAQRTEKYEVTTRAIQEFCLDYGVPLGEYERFVDLLSRIAAPHVEFRGYLFERLFAEES